jgi:hypothetical protein
MFMPTHSASFNNMQRIVLGKSSLVQLSTGNHAEVFSELSLVNLGDMYNNRDTASATVSSLKSFIEAKTAEMLTAAGSSRVIYHKIHTPSFGGSMLLELYYYDSPQSLSPLSYSYLISLNNFGLIKSVGPELGNPYSNGNGYVILNASTQSYLHIAPDTGSSYAPATLSSDRRIHFPQQYASTGSYAFTTYYTATGRLNFIYCDSGPCTSMDYSSFDKLLIPISQRLVITSSEFDHDNGSASTDIRINSIAIPSTNLHFNSMVHTITSQVPEKVVFLKYYAFYTPEIGFRFALDKISSYNTLTYVESDSLNASEIKDLRPDTYMNGHQFAGVRMQTFDKIWSPTKELFFSVKGSPNRLNFYVLP